MNEGITVWAASLDHDAATISALRQSLSPQEIERARSFRDAAISARYIARHAVLRLCIARELGVEAVDVPLNARPNNKPVLETGDIRFSISSCGSLALFAISRTAEVGVDVEEINPDLADPGFLFLTPTERIQVAADSAGTLFYRIWARKEACIKVTGAGLAYPLETLDVLSRPGSSGSIQIGSVPISFEDIFAADGYAAAVAWQD